MTDTWQRRLASFLAKRDHSAELERELSDLLARAAAQRGDTSGATRLEPFDQGAAPSQAGDATPTETSTGRFEDLGRIGHGSGSEVRRVRDRSLNRVMALKVISAAAMADDVQVARFLEEARVTALLQHPAIVPVHEIGRLPDGRLYYTMKELQGRRLSAVIVEVHGASPGERWEAAPSGWSFRRLVEAYHQVCQAVAHAHTVGVIHGDLNSNNVVVGAHGEVYVVNWGLPQQSGLAEPDAGADVYALGAILYEVLKGQTPFSGEAEIAVVAAGLPMPRGRAGAGPAPDGGGPPLPNELVAACSRAMAQAPADRFADASGLAEAVGGWLAEARQRERALGVVAQARGRAVEAAQTRLRAQSLRAEAEAELAQIPVWASEDVKAPAWERADRAEALDAEAERADIAAEEGFQAALTHAPDLPDAHAELTALYQSRHAVAEGAGQTDEVDRTEALLRAHALALPESHARRGEAVTYLKGTGAVTLVTEPSGAEVLLYRYEPIERRLIPAFERVLGRTPLLAEPLPMGSWLLIVRAPGVADVRYPIVLGRGEHWDGIPPGGSTPWPILLPPEHALGAEDIYVPAGWFRSGGDPNAAESLPAGRRWVDGFVIRRFPVTNTEFIAFLDDLVRQGRGDEALRAVPRENRVSDDADGAVIYGQHEDGRFYLRPDADGDVWEPEMPVLMIGWPSAEAYVAWLAASTGRPWRLPWTIEREKAARGVDGRWYPWGNTFDASWCAVQDSFPEFALPTRVGRFEADVSVYGVRDVAGNASDLCADFAEPDETAPEAPLRRFVCGGGWCLPAPHARCARRSVQRTGYRMSYTTVRAVFSLGDRAGS